MVKRRGPLGETSSRSHARSVRALSRKRQITARLRKGLPLQGSSLPSLAFRFSVHANLGAVDKLHGRKDEEPDMSALRKTQLSERRCTVRRATRGTHPTIDRQINAVNERCFLTGKECDDASDLPELPATAKRYTVHKLLP